MQCRAVARRCPLGSVTVLGDLAQATTPWAPGDWARTLAHLGHDGAAVRPLTVGYRVPGEVLQIANRLLPHIAPDVPPASSVRQGDDALTYGRDLLAAVRTALDVEGSIGVICPDARAAAVVAELAAAGVEAHALDEDADRRITVVPASGAKGLEFDSVVLLEPAEIVAAEATRLGAGCAGSTSCSPAPCPACGSCTNPRYPANCSNTAHFARRQQRRGADVDVGRWHPGQPHLFQWTPHGCGGGVERSQATRTPVRRSREACRGRGCGCCTRGGRPAARSSRSTQRPGRGP